ncbi:hypothetical protein L210DRAFT_3485679, partial [Boletus edulis BED1]
GKKGFKLATQVPAAEFVIESIGNARTLFNPNASRFGKYSSQTSLDKTEGISHFVPSVPYFDNAHRRRHRLPCLGSRTTPRSFPPHRQVSPRQR